MKFVLGEFAEIIIDIFGSNFEGFVEGFTLGEFGKRRGGGDGRGAAVSFPTDVGDFIGFLVDFDVHFHLVATDGVADYASGVTFELGFVAHQEVTGVQKVVFDCVRVNPILAFVHRDIIPLFI